MKKSRLSWLIIIVSIAVFVSILRPALQKAFEVPLYTHNQRYYKLIKQTFNEKGEVPANLNEFNIKKDRIVYYNPENWNKADKVFLCTRLKLLFNEESYILTTGDGKDQIIPVNLGLETILDNFDLTKHGHINNDKTITPVQKS